MQQANDLEMGVMGFNHHVMLPGTADICPATAHLCSLALACKKLPPKNTSQDVNTIIN